MAPPCSAGPPRSAPLGSLRSTAADLSAPGRAAPPAPASHRSCPARRGNSRPQPPASCRAAVGSAAHKPLEQSKPRPKSENHTDCSAPANINRAAASLTLQEYNSLPVSKSRERGIKKGTINPRIPESIHSNDSGFPCLRGSLSLNSLTGNKNHNRNRERKRKKENPQK